MKEIFYIEFLVTIQIFVGMAEWEKVEFTKHHNLYLISIYSRKKSSESWSTFPYVENFIKIILFKNK